MNKKKGFILVDSLICIGIVTTMCLLCFSLFVVINSFNKGYPEYQMKSNEHYEEIFNSVGECVKCIKEEEKDLSQQEP